MNRVARCHRDTDREGRGGRRGKREYFYVHPTERRETESDRPRHRIENTTKQQQTGKTGRAEKNTMETGGEKLGGSRWMILPPAQTEKTVLRRGEPTEPSEKVPNNLDTILIVFTKAGRENTSTAIYNAFKKRKTLLSSSWCNACPSVPA